MAHDDIPKLSMSAAQAAEELAAIRRKLREIDQRWIDYSAEQRERQERYDARTTRPTHRTDYRQEGIDGTPA